MYKKGDAKLLLNGDAMTVEESDAHDDVCTYEDHIDAGPGLGRFVVALPHQCGKWLIGGPVEIADLIADLTAILAQGKQDRALPEE